MKQYNLYTFEKAKFIYTKTESIEQAIKNFKERIDIDHNGYYHPNMDYLFERPMYMLTRGNNNQEKIIGFNYEKLREQLF
jgi:hypothetical protein